MRQTEIARETDKKKEKTSNSIDLVQAFVTGVVEEGNPLWSGGAMEILQKGIRWGAMEILQKGLGSYGNTTEGNPLSGGAMEILQKGIRWGAVTGLGE